MQLLPLLSLFALTLAKDSVNLADKLIDEVRGFEVRDYTFQPPYSPNLHWTIGGFTMVTPKRIVLTRDLPSLHGTLWNKKPVTMRDWEALVTFRIVGSGKPADGIAFWYTRSTGTGSAYGAPETFTGIGVAVDTYSNEGAQLDRINILFNRGDKVFNGEEDGKSLLVDRMFDNSSQLTCTVSGFTLYDGSSKKVKTVKLLVRYFEENLSVYYAGYDSDSWSLCGSAQGLHLPLNYRVGVSAMTGDLHSAHELVTFKMFELHGKHAMEPFSEPIFFGQTLGMLDFSGTLGASESTVSAIFWGAFKLAFYSALVAGVGFFGMMIYRGLGTRRNKFY